MLIKNFQLGQLETNCYIVTDENTLESAVIDPGDESNTVLDYIESNKLKVKDIFLTHGHFDHTGAAATISQETGAPIWINEKDLGKGTGDFDDFYRYEPEGQVNLYRDGDEIAVGSMVFKVIETPGHSKGSVTLRCGDVLFTGDTLFAGGAGRVDLPGGDMADIMMSLKKIASLDGDFEVYPGHMDATRLDIERSENPFVQAAVKMKE